MLQYLLLIPDTSVAGGHSGGLLRKSRARDLERDLEYSSSGDALASEQGKHKDDKGELDRFIQVELLYLFVEQLWIARILLEHSFLEPPVKNGLSTPQQKQVKQTCANIVDQ